MNLLFENETAIDVDKELIAKVVRQALTHENVTDNSEISVTIVNNEEIQKLNKKFRNIDRATDVLSFPLYDYTKEALPTDGSTAYLGDIVISAERARQQAEEYGHSFEREIGFLTAHSMLHLLGYDHMEPEEERVMFKKQEEILEQIGLKR